MSWTDEERSRLGEMAAADAAAARALTGASMLLPAVDRLREPRAEDVPRSVFRFPVLPSMLGVGGHFDHAAVLELAGDAHLLGGGSDGGREGTFFSACINHNDVAAVGDILEAVATANDARVVTLRNAKTLSTVAIVDFGPR